MSHEAHLTPTGIRLMANKTAGQNAANNTDLTWDPANFTSAGVTQPTNTEFVLPPGRWLLEAGLLTGAANNATVTPRWVDAANVPLASVIPQLVTGDLFHQFTVGAYVDTLVPLTVKLRYLTAVGASAPQAASFVKILQLG